MGPRNMWPYRICAWRRMLGWILPVFTEKCGVSGLLSCSQLQYNQRSYCYLNLYTWTWLCLDNIIWVAHDHSVHTVLTVSVRLIVMFNSWQSCARLQSTPYISTYILLTYHPAPVFETWCFGRTYYDRPCVQGVQVALDMLSTFFFTFFVTVNLEQYL